MVVPGRSFRTRCAASALALLFTAGSLSAQVTGDSGKGAEKAGLVPWARNLSEAVRQGLASRRPILLHFNDDSLSAWERLETGLLEDPGFLELSRRFVCLVGDPGAHDPVPGTPRICPRFGCISCTDHRRIWSQASLEVSGSPRPTAPQFVFLAPDRTFLHRSCGGQSRDEVLAEMQQVLDWFENPEYLGPFSVDRWKALLAQATSQRVWERRAAIEEVARSPFPRAIAFLDAQTRPEAGEMLRQSALKAMKGAHNPNTLHLIIPLLAVDSGQLKRNAVFALRNLGLVEAVPPLIASYKRQTTTRLKALILRVVARMDPSNPEVRRLHREALADSGPQMRVHALRACLDLPMVPSDVEGLAGMAAAATSLKVQAVACYVVTELLLRSAEDKTDWGEADDGYGRRRVPQGAGSLEPQRSKVLAALEQVAAAGRTDDIRSYAQSCLEALRGGSAGPFRAGVLRYHDDDKDEVFKEY